MVFNECKHKLSLAFGRTMHLGHQPITENVCATFGFI